jgi:hypothetical protein
MEVIPIETTYLDAVLEAVELDISVSSLVTFHHYLLVFSHRTSQQELAIWQPAWPTVHAKKPTH